MQRKTNKYRQTYRMLAGGGSVPTPMLLLCSSLLLNGCWDSNSSTSKTVTPPVGEVCIDNPFPDTTFYLKGEMNSWSAHPLYAFNYQCNAFVLNTHIEEGGSFKIADADWTLETSFGGTDQGGDITLQSPLTVATGEGGPNLTISDSGDLTFRLDTSISTTEPVLTVTQTQGCITPPFADKDLYLRGGLNGWGADDAYKFTYICNSYQLATQVKEATEMKIADADWTLQSSFGGGASGSTLTEGESLPMAIGEELENLTFDGQGGYLFKLDISESSTEPTLLIKSAEHVPDPKISNDRARLIPAEKFLTDEPWSFLGKLTEWSQQENLITLHFENDKSLQLQLLGDGVFRVRFNQSNDYKNDRSYAVIKKDLGETAAIVTDLGDKLVVKTDALQLEINKAPFKLNVIEQDRVVQASSQGIGWNGKRVGVFNKMMDDVKFYGFGEKTGHLLKNGQSMKMWNSDTYKYDENTDPIYTSIPFFIETDGKYASGILFDNTYQSYFNIGEHKTDEYYFGALDGEVDYYYIHGDSVKQVIQKYTELTGRIQMPPKWALGYQQSRYSYESAQRIDELATEFRTRKLPVDTFYLDIGFMDEKRSFTWNKNNFPDLKGMLDKQHEQGFKFITIIDPHIKIDENYHVYNEGIKGDHFLKMPDGSLSAGEVWPGKSVFPDYSRPETREWWGSLYQPLVDAGMDGFWNDMNEPSVFSPLGTLPLDTVHYDFGQNSSHEKMHNVYGLTMIQSTLEGVDKLRPQQRNFVLSRAGYAGVQRYAAVWTGDNTANWSHLKLNISMGLSLGLSGVPINGADVGGYAGEPTPELFTRWMEVGAFLPLYRNHTESGTADQEPWVYGPEVENISRKYLELRYQLLQMLYDFTYQAHTTGLPIARPVFMEFPDDAKTYGIEDSFLYGDAMLVAPVIEAGVSTRDVYLPKGSDWYNFWTEQRYAGGTTQEVAAPLDTLPLFVKAGAIIPTQKTVQYVGEVDSNPITFKVYPGSEAGSSYSYTLYRDDENSKSYQQGDYREMTITHTQEIDKQSLTLNVRHDGYTPTEAYLQFLLLQAKEPKQVTLDGTSISLDADCQFSADANSYCYDKSKGAVLLQVQENAKDHQVQVSY